MTTRFSRRSFLKSTAAFGAGVYILPKGIAAPSPNDQPAVGLIGCGGQGRGDAKSASRFGRIVAVCDVDDARVDEAKKQWPDATTYKDFRKLLERKDLHA
ncbi:MAG TPA: gfo/Idh/MocA family oxidoreductase, partial [Verrucomicrobiae bacterium]|nr:gfo/Idh/MocA family oxidoreductase [Verrucomicrobiae bacterium]